MTPAARAASAIAVLLSSLGLSAVLDVSRAAAASFTAGDIVVYRVGTGTALTSDIEVSKPLELKHAEAQRTGKSFSL